MTDPSGPDEIVPDADRLEQEAPVAPDTDPEPVRIPIDVPEADALEQSLPGPLPDEDDEPR